MTDLYINFDVERYLQDRGVNYAGAGSKNVSAGHIGLDCPWCNDHGNHLGICLSTKKANCWRCGRKSIVGIVQWLEGGCSAAEANTIIHAYRYLSFAHLDTPKRKGESVSKILFPVGAVHPLPKPHSEYLKGRGFNSEALERDFNLYGITIGTAFKQRIIIPVTVNGVLVTFTSLDITGKQEPKYKALSPEQSRMSIKDCVYNLDTVRDTVLVLEGPTDVWRCGAGSVCTFGKTFTKRQVELLLRKGVRRAFIMFDGETEEDNRLLTLKQSERLAHALAAEIPEVEIIEMSHGDPGELTDEQVKELRSQIGLE